ncbi:MAG: pilus assembly protein PilP [Pseudomonadota bacterium]
MKIKKFGLALTLLILIYSRAKGEGHPDHPEIVAESKEKGSKEIPSEDPQMPVSEQETEKPSQTPSDSSKEANGQVGKTDQANLGAENTSEQAWDSSIGHEDAGRIALDVTNGIRIKDIVQPSAEYHFASFGRPDPFVPQIRLNRKDSKNLKESDPGYEEIQVTSILQKYSITDLVVVGIWSPKNAAKKALVSTPSGEGVVVQMGDSIGMKAGKVIAISDTFVSVREFEISFDGTRQFQDQKLWITGKKPKENEFIRLGAQEQTKEKSDGVEPQRPVTPIGSASNPQFPPLPPSSSTGGAMNPQSMPSTYTRQISGDTVGKPSASNMIAPPNILNEKTLLPPASMTGAEL